MPTYSFKALSGAGERVSGEVSAPNEQAVLAELDSRGLTAFDVAEAPQAVRRAPRPSARSLGTAYQQLSDLLRAGVPLLRGLRLLAGRKAQPRLAEAFRDLADAVAAGEDLGTAMGRRPEAFAPVHVAMVRAGERGGFLDDVLGRLGQLLLAQAELRSKLLGNLIYPAILVVLGGGILIVLFAVFVPMFRKLFEKIEGGPPPITRLVFGISDLIVTFWPLTLAAIVAASAGAGWGLRRPGMKRRLDSLRARLWVVGPLTRALAAARFCRMLGTMLDNGVPMLTAMQIAREAAGNTLMEEAIDRAADAVRAGQPLAPQLAASGLFEDEAVEMIAVGEQANNLDSVLITVAETTERRVDRLLTTAVRLVEPLLLVVLATVVVIVAVALLLPMTRMSGSL